MGINVGEKTMIPHALLLVHPYLLAFKLNENVWIKGRHSLLLILMQLHIHSQVVLCWGISSK